MQVIKILGLQMIVHYLAFQFTNKAAKIKLKKPVTWYLFL